MVLAVVVSDRDAETLRALALRNGVISAHAAHDAGLSVVASAVIHSAATLIRQHWEAQ